MNNQSLLNNENDIEQTLKVMEDQMYLNLNMMIENNQHIQEINSQLEDINESISNLNKKLNNMVGDNS